MSKGRETALIFNKNFKTNEIMNNLNDQYNQIVVTENGAGDKLVLYNVYLPPTEMHEQHFDAFMVRLKQILTRYVNLKMVVYGDFNMTRIDIRKKVILPL